MLQKVQVEDAGDTSFLEGDLVDKITFREETRRFSRGAEGPRLSNRCSSDHQGVALDGELHTPRRASRKTTRVLTDAAVRGKTDFLYGLKENVIMGT